MSKLLVKKTPVLTAQPSARIFPIGGGACYVDEKDAFWLSHFRWRLYHGKYKKYAYRRFTIDGKTHTIKMHRELMNCPKDMETHHKDLNGLNNCKDNLVNLTPIDHRLAHGKSR